MFHVISEHRPWCPWVVSICSNDGTTSPAGWRLLLGTLLTSMSPTSSNLLHEVTYSLNRVTLVFMLSLYLHANGGQCTRLTGLIIVSNFGAIHSYARDAEERNASVSFKSRERACIFPIPLSLAETRDCQQTSDSLTGYIFCLFVCLSTDSSTGCLEKSQKAAQRLLFLGDTTVVN